MKAMKATKAMKTSKMPKRNKPLKPRLKATKARAIPQARRPPVPIPQAEVTVRGTNKTVPLHTIILAKICARMLGQLPKKTVTELQRKLNKLGVLPTGSVCSGAGTDALAQEVLLDVLGAKCKTEEVFSCECEPFKASWLKSVVHADHGDHCVYCNVKDLNAEEAHCFTHSPPPSERSNNKSAKKCKVKAQKILILSAGTSCKKLSKLMKDRAKFKGCMSDESGSTGETLRATIRLLQMYEVPFCLFENVGDLVEDAQDENLIAMIRLLKEAGYACSYRKTCASRSMIPQRRGIVYFIAINWRRCRRTFEEAKSITDEAMTIVAHLEGLNILPFDLFLLPDNSKELEAFRVKFMEDKRAQPELNDDNVWARKALMLFDKREISWSSATVDEKTKASPWFSVLPTRQGQVLGFMSQWDPEGRTVDVIHAIDRAARSSFIPNSEYIGKADLLCSCVLPNCRMWDKKRCRLIL